MFKCDICNKTFVKEVQLKAHFHPIINCSCTPIDTRPCQDCVSNGRCKLTEVPCNGRCGFGPNVDCLVAHFEYVKF